MKAVGYWKGRKRGPMSPEHRAKIAAARTGKKLTRAHARAISIGKKAQMMSPENRAKATVNLVRARLAQAEKRRAAGMVPCTCACPCKRCGGRR